MREAVMTLGKRIALGIIIMLLLMFVVGGAGYIGLVHVAKVTAFYRNVNQLKLQVSAVKGATDQYLIALYNEDMTRAKESYNTALARLEKAAHLTQVIKQDLKSDAQENQELDRVKRNLKLYKAALTA